MAHHPLKKLLRKDKLKYTKLCEVYFSKSGFQPSRREPEVARSAPLTGAGETPREQAEAEQGYWLTRWCSDPSCLFGERLPSGFCLNLEACAGGGFGFQPHHGLRASSA